jgi:hypothetical protein
MTISASGRGLVRRLGLAAATILVFAASSGQRAEALSLVSPGTAPSAKHAVDAMTIAVRGGHGHGGGGGFHGGGGGFRGGGAAFHGGGFRAGGAVIHGGGLRAAPVFRGGGISGIRYGGYRVAPYYRHRHFHRRFYAPSYYYDYPRYYYPRRHCRIVWTYWGPRKICRYRPWLRHHYWRHRVHYRYW